LETPNRMPCWRATFSQVPTMSRPGPTRSVFQAWWRLANMSRLSWWLAIDMKYLAPAAWYFFISPWGSQFWAFQRGMNSMKPNVVGWP
jgi:hypothetical protein